MAYRFQRLAGRQSSNDDDRRARPMNPAIAGLLAAFAAALRCCRRARALPPRRVAAVARRRVDGGDADRARVRHIARESRAAQHRIARRCCRRWRSWRWVSQASATPAGARRSGWPTSFHRVGRARHTRSRRRRRPAASDPRGRAVRVRRRACRYAGRRRSGADLAGVVRVARSRSAACRRWARRRVAACRSRRRTLATDRAAEAAARQCQSGRIRPRGVAARATTFAPPATSAIRGRNVRVDAFAGRARRLCPARPRADADAHRRVRCRAAPYAGVIAALAIGDQRAIPEAQWPVFNRTGVAHLISISGLHVTVFATLAGGCALLACRRSTRSRRASLRARSRRSSVSCSRSATCCSRAPKCPPCARC